MNSQKTSLEICVDNVESIDTVNKIGVESIELCSSLALGGISPTLSLLDYAFKNTTIPIQAMVRPRPGNFNYSEAELNACINEISLMKQFNISGIVFGALTDDNKVDINACKKIYSIAHQLNLELTFHRAVDMTLNYEEAIEQIIEIGFTRILTSGHTDNVEKGIETLAEMQSKHGSQIQIMAGGGVKSSNIELLQQANLKYIHCSASMSKIDKTNYKLGQNSSDLSYQITDNELLKTIKKKLN
jgi:copper homeostasis protein